MDAVPPSSTAPRGGCDAIRLRRGGIPGWLAILVVGRPPARAAATVLSISAVFDRSTRILVPTAGTFFDKKICMEYSMKSICEIFIGIGVTFRDESNDGN